MFCGSYYSSQYVTCHHVMLELRCLTEGEGKIEKYSTEESLDRVQSQDDVSEGPIRDASEDDAESTTSKSNCNSDSDGKLQSQWKGFIKRLKISSAMHLHTFHPTIPSLPSIKMLPKWKSRNTEQSIPVAPTPDLRHCFQAHWKNFLLSDLQKATDNFSRGMISFVSLLFCLWTIQFYLNICN